MAVMLSVGGGGAIHSDFAMLSPMNHIPLCQFCSMQHRGALDPLLETGRPDCTPFHIFAYGVAFSGCCRAAYSFLPVSKSMGYHDRWIPALPRSCRAGLVALAVSVSVSVCGVVGRSVGLVSAAGLTILAVSDCDVVTHHCSWGERGANRLVTTDR